MLLTQEDYDRLDCKLFVVHAHEMQKKTNKLANRSFQEPALAFHKYPCDETFKKLENALDKIIESYQPEISDMMGYL